MSEVARAPGKVMLAGEYAVLHGHAAVMMAVDRHAVASVVPGTSPSGPFLRAAYQVCCQRFGGSDARSLRMHQATVDTQRFRQDGRKVGLGSSAAATVAALAVALGSDGGGLDKALLHELAHEAHGRAQAPRGARGSGADVAVSVHGGFLGVVPRGRGLPEVRRMPTPERLFVSWVWTGTSASTPKLVAHVARWQQDHPDAHDLCMQALADAADGLAGALARGRGIVVATTAGRLALERLAHESGAPLVPPGIAPVVDLADQHGGAAKPTGAGGGDLVLVTFEEHEAKQAFDAESEDRGMHQVAAGVDPVGARLGAPLDTENGTE